MTLCVKESARSSREHHGLEVCGEAADGREAIAKARDLKPDIIVIDIAMPMLNGLAATKQITARVSRNQSSGSQHV